jgi:hypothetical protein
MHWRSEAEIEDLVARFEACTVAPAEWRHAEHLTVALVYLLRMPIDAATARMREGLARLNAVHGAPETLDRGYHETITVFFMRKIRRFLDEAGAGRPIAELAAELAARSLGKKDVLEHYSRERIMSWEAKRGWVEPDVKSLD